MAYILKGTKSLIGYWKTLGQPCLRRDMACAVKSTTINFEADGREPSSLSLQYGEAEAQSLAAALGVTVANITTNGGQIQI